MDVTDALGVAGIAAIAAVVGSIVTLIVKRLEERRLRAVAALERDLRSAELFVSLMNMANARGATHLVPEAAQAIAQSPRFAQLLAATGNDPQADSLRLLEIKELVSSTLVATPVGRAAQLAAGQLAASLADRYPTLRPAALAGLREVKTFLPPTEVDFWAKRWALPRWRTRLAVFLRLS